MAAYKPDGSRFAATKRKVMLFSLLFFLVASLFFVNANNTNAHGTLMNRSWLSIAPALPDGTELSLDIEQDAIEAEPKITFTFTGTWIDELMIDNEQFRQLRVPGIGATGEIGQPEMPFKGLFLEIPYGVDVELQILNQETVSLGVGPKIYPRQEPMPDMADADTPPFAIDSDAYAADQWFPFSPIEVEAPAFIREKRVVFVKIFPMSYNPGTGELIAFESLSFKLIWRGEIDPTASEQKNRLRSDVFDSMAQKLINNYMPELSPEVDAVNDSAAEYIPTQKDNETEETFGADTEQTSEARTGPELSTTNAADYLIIVYDSFAEEILPLANWKNRMGYKTRVVNMSTVGTTYTHVKNYIQNAYDTWNPAPSFVLLVGDYNQVPSHNAGIYHPYHYTSNWPTDHIYACTAGSDYFADLAIGRLSVETEAECTTVVNKILEYERTPNTGTWWDDALMAALFQDRDGLYTVKDGTADRYFMETATHILDYLDGTVGYDIETAQCTDYWPLEYTTFHYRSSSYPHRPTPPDPVPTAVVNRWTSASQSTTDITTAINGGVGLVLHRDHGGETGWGDPPYYVSHVNALTNGDMTPVVYSMNCLTGAFDYAYGDCFAEAFQKNSSGGASGVVAATRVSYSGYNDLLTRGTFDSFWDGYDTSYSATNSWRVAEALNYAKYYMYTYEGSGTYTQIEFYLFHWFGDPSMMMRTTSPQTLTVSHDATIPQSATSFTVNVTQNGALVALEQDGNVLGTATSSGGSATVIISGSLSPSTVYVTVTNHDYLPYEGTVTVGGGGTCNPFTENFDDGLANNWLNDGSGTWAVTSGVYRMTGSTPASSTVRTTYYDGDSADFTYEARVRKTSGSTSTSMGVIFRSSDGAHNNNAYTFHINANGSYTYYKYVGGIYTWLAGSWISSPAINTGLNVWNTLKVAASGTQFDLYCNGTLLTSFTDSSLSSGKPGLKAYDTSYDSDVVEFDDVLLSCDGGPALGDELAADFGPNGLWHYSGASWSKLTPWNPDDDLAGWSGGLAVDFGGNGLWNHDGTSWSKKTPWNPGTGGLAGWSGGLAVDFDTNGLWVYDGTAWSKKTWWDPEDDLTGWSGGLAVDFGTNGLWNYDGTAWSKKTPWNPGTGGLAGWSGGLAVDFDANGLWSYDGSSWRKLTPWNPEGMAGWNGSLGVDFGGNGLWSYDGSSWRKLTPWNPTGLSGWVGGLAVDFGTNGLWNHDGTAWSKKTPWHCENMGDVDLN